MGTKNEPSANRCPFRYTAFGHTVECARERHPDNHHHGTDAILGSFNWLDPLGLKIGDRVRLREPDDAAGDRIGTIEEIHPPDICSVVFADIWWDAKPEAEQLQQRFLNGYPVTKLVRVEEDIP